MPHWLTNIFIQTAAVTAFTLGVQIAEGAEVEPPQRFEFLQIRMGVPVRILVYAPDSDAANVAAEAAYARLKQIDRRLSDYDPDSEVMQLTARARPGEPTAVSRELIEILAASQQLANETGGAFDVTVGPIVKLWRVARRKKALPNSQSLTAALAKVGHQKLLLNEADSTVTFTVSNMELDFGAIAKGDAADQALQVLREHGLSRALVAVAGDIVVGDPPPSRTGWKIEVEKLHGAGTSGAPHQLLLSNAAVSTSGDAYQFVEIDGVRYSHIVDPRTGIGLTTPSSVTVVAPTGRLADSLSTAVSVMGPDQGLALIANHPGTDTLMVRFNERGELERVTSPGWERLPRP